MIVNIIDVSGFIYRAFYGLPNIIFEGKELGAVYGFCSEMLKLLKKFPHSMFIAAFDSSRKTFRTEIYGEYKANRESMPQELVAQIHLIKEASNAFGFIGMEFPGYEADDIVASCSKKASEKGCGVNIISSDKDLLQLLNPSAQIRVFDPMKKKYISEEDVFEKFGVKPYQILDVLALMGDSSDNIPGVPGIGPKTAAALINKFKTLENLIENVENLPKSQKFNKIRENIDMALISKKLASLYCDLDINFEYRETQPKDLLGFFNRFRFKSLIGRI